MRAEDEREFEQLVTQRHAALRRTALVLCGDVGQAEDLVQTVLLRLYRRWGRRHDIRDLDAYLHVSLVNASRSWWRRSWRADRLTSDDAVRDPDEPQAAFELRDQLARALAQLPVGQREVLVLRYLAELSEQETAEALGCAVGTVKSRCHRALLALRSSGLLEPAKEH